MTTSPPDTFDPAASADRLLPWRKVKELTGISRTTAWRMQNAGDFPRPVVISAGRVGWRESDVTAWKTALVPRGARSTPTQPRFFEPEADVTQASEPATASPEPAARSVPTRRSKRATRRRPVATGQLTFDF
ncbi:MAG: AlpA family phage regulatory protein [Phenylobacterium sp.]|uniref:helix-turn-helix transcriptional regulator n=1 Tax=Phenylobacterium sp. TaxID=1871053 RepID=UPI0027373081|nr:AlpA family phage regulatory protein [Phenylobacterium sp.]MDP3747823.1 AlpA family phage regulatory protein [Phenylobacterium sp.]